MSFSFLSFIFINFFDFIFNFWFIIVFYSFFFFLLISLVNEYLFLTHFFNKNAIKSFEYYSRLDYFSIFNKLSYINILFKL